MHDHMRPQKPPTDKQVIVEDRVPALLERWRREHDRMAEPKEAG
jgi:hypothetical protein